MKIALLGYGKEGRATEEYFKKQGAEVVVFENFTLGDLEKRDFSSYDLVFRSPSVPFRSPVSDIPNLTSVTRYFFDCCPCPIIGVTASKGKGTTCSFIKSLLESFGEDVHLVGNIGIPAISELGSLKPTSVVVYEMSSFQLWDLKKSPKVAVVGTIAPDHLNVHDGFSDYIHAKSNICRYQSPKDYIIYYKNNPDSAKIAEFSPAGNRLSYPYVVPEEIRSAVKLPGEHNLNNALGALAAVASYYNSKISDNGISDSKISDGRKIGNSSQTGTDGEVGNNHAEVDTGISSNFSQEKLQQFIATNLAKICDGLSNCQGLPHRLQYLCDFNGVSYYDDNFSTNPASTRVAVRAFPERPVVLIAGGRDKTENADLPEIAEILKLPNIAKVILMGESGHQIFKDFPSPAKFILAKSLEDAVSKARFSAEEICAVELKNETGSNQALKSKALGKKTTNQKTLKTSRTSAPVVLMSPAAASFDMFKDVYDRGAKYQDLIKSLA